MQKTDAVFGAWKRHFQELEMAFPSPGNAICFAIYEMSSFVT
jgi:hypothetical protein